MWEAVQTPKIVTGKAIHPLLDKIAVAVKPLPIVQPPAHEAPIPIKIHPSVLLPMVDKSGKRQRNSREPFAARKEPRKIPNTRKTPQPSCLLSPVII